MWTQLTNGHCLRSQLWLLHLLMSYYFWHFKMYKKHSGIPLANHVALAHTQCTHVLMKWTILEALWNLAYLYCWMDAKKVFSHNKLDCGLYSLPFANAMCMFRFNYWFAKLTINNWMIKLTQEKGGRFHDETNQCFSAAAPDHCLVSVMS